ncbi:hypothetical protein H0H92_003890 [Tricholoma furcatifolium]|nr:hypothetical protein H0H92_003890 [Tricholoma furcatifolium]
MSVADSRLKLESPSTENAEPFDEIPVQEQEEKAALEKLTSLNPPTSTGPVIAIDLDDVLSETNHMVADWHNKTYGTDMDVSSFYYYYYWKNPFWGTPMETFLKVKDFYATDLIYRTKVVPGAREGVQALRDMGFRLIIVTARTEDNADESWEWVSKHFPGLFESIICTGQFKDAHKTGHEIVTKLSKAQVCADLGAVLLIDDSAENALQCATYKEPTQVLLFGDYQWNKRLSGPEDAKDEMAFDRRLELAGGKEFWKEETVSIPEGAPLTRVKDWAEVVRWVQSAKLMMAN